MLKRFHDKNGIAFTICWIVAYCFLMSLGDAFSAVIKVEKSITFVVALALSVGLILFLMKNDLLTNYGLCLPKASAKAMLFYIPILFMLTANFWWGIAINYSIMETILYILTMVCVGFLEEVIFRGLLFNSMAKDNVKMAIIVSSLTFGIGHIINLVNGSGVDLLSNLLQVVYATAAGFMFVMIYVKSKSLMVCIISHGLFNAFSAFSSKTGDGAEAMLITAICLTVITGSYAAYLYLSTEKT